MTSGEFREIDIAGYLDSAFHRGELMDTIAQAALEQPTVLDPDEIANVIMPPKQAGEALSPRWQLVEGANDIIKRAAEQNEHEVLALADQLGMRRSESLSEIDTARIQPDIAVWTVEGGANRTSVVRRTIVIEAMQKVYGEDIAHRRIFQFGSDRAIERERNGKPNAEYGVARAIAGDHLPKDDSLTEFGLNLASAQQDDWEITGVKNEINETELVVRLRKKGFPELVLVQISKEEGLKGGFSAVAKLTGSLEGKQLVIATNGQYRPKDEVQADQWDKANGVNTLPPVAIGDEPGYKVTHAGQEITTSDRAPIIYVHEFVVLHRLLNR